MRLSQRLDAPASLTSDLVLWNTPLWLSILAGSSHFVFSSLYPSRKTTGHYMNHGNQVMRRLTYSRDIGIHFSTQEENNRKVVKEDKENKQTDRPGKRS